MAIDKNTLIAFAVGIVLLGGAAYSLFGKGSSVPTVQVTDISMTSDTQNTFLNLAAQLEPVGFDTAILSDSRFMALTDIHTSIIPEVTGKRDPFSAQ